MSRSALALVVAGGAALASAPAAVRAQAVGPSSPADPASAAAPRLADAPRRFEVRPFVGAFVPYGAMHDVAGDAFALGGTVAYGLTPQLRTVGTLVWGNSRARRIAGGNNQLDVFQYDAGLEYAPVSFALWNGRVQPVVAGGAGGRSYSFRNLDLDSQTNFAGYAGAGVEFALDRVNLRVGARNYWTDFKYAVGDRRARGRTDVMFGTGLGFKF